MKLKQLDRNVTEVMLGNFIILFSYENPVAAFSVFEVKDYSRLLKTTRKFGQKTEEHIEKWVNGEYTKQYQHNSTHKLGEIEQDFFTCLVGERPLSGKNYQF